MPIIRKVDIAVLVACLSITACAKKEYSKLTPQSGGALLSQAVSAPSNTSTTALASPAAHPPAAPLAETTSVDGAGADGSATSMPAPAGAVVETIDPLKGPLTPTQLAQNDAIAREFAEKWCENKRLGPAVRVTVERLLQEVGETNCLVAGALLSQLTALDLSSTAHVKKVRDLRPLAVFTNLKTLVLSFNAVTDVDDLGPLVNLEKLNLSHTQLKSFKGLKYLRSLRYLDLSFSGIKSANLKSLLELEQVRSITLAGNALTAIPELPGDLEYLDLSGNLLAAITPGVGAANLKRLDLGHNKLTSLRDITAFKALTELGLAENDIPATEIKYLWNLTALEKLALDRHVQDAASDLLVTLKQSAPRLEFAPGIVIPLDAE